MIKAVKADKNEVIDILYASFENNQSVNYIVKQDRHKARRLRYLMEYSFDICNLSGDIYLSDDRKACALLSYPNRKAKFSLAATLLDIKLILKTIGFGGIQKALNREKTIKANYPTQDFTYLWFIGVRPSEQGKGTGSKLLTEILASSQSVYLETSTLANLPWYEKFGFQIFKDLDFGYKLYMLRRR